MALGLPFKRWVNIDPGVGTIELNQSSRPSPVQDWQTTICTQVFGRLPIDVTDTEKTSSTADNWLGYDLPYEASADLGFDLKMFALNRGQTATADDGTGFKLVNHTGSFFDCYHPADVANILNRDLENAVAPYNCFDSITRRNFFVFVDQRNQWVRDEDGNYQEKLTVVEYQLVYDTTLASATWPIIEGPSGQRDYLELGRWEIPIELPTAMSDHLQAAPADGRGGAFSRFRSNRLEDDAALPAVSLANRFLVVMDICVLNGIFYMFFNQNQVIAFTLENGFIEDSYVVYRLFGTNPNAQNYFRPRGYFLDTEKILMYQRLRGSMYIYLWPPNPDFSDPTLLKQVVERNAGFDGQTWQPSASTNLPLARADVDNVQGSGLPVLVFPEMDGVKISRMFVMYCTRTLVTDGNGKKYPSNLNRWVLYSYGFRYNPAGLSNRNFPRRGEVEFGQREGPEFVYAPVDSQSDIQAISSISPWNTDRFESIQSGYNVAPYNFNYHTGPSWKGQPYFGGPYYHRLSRLLFPIRVRLTSEDVTLDREVRQEVTTGGDTESQTRVIVRGENIATADVQVAAGDSFFVDRTEDYSFYYNGYRYHILEADRVSRTRWKLKLRVTNA